MLPWQQSITKQYIRCHSVTQNGFDDLHTRMTLFGPAGPRLRPAAVTRLRAGLEIPGSDTIHDTRQRGHLDDFKGHFDADQRGAGHGFAAPATEEWQPHR